MFYVYILNSLNNGRYYVGSCKDIENRLNQHNIQEVKSTKAYVPWKLVYQEEFDMLSKARSREKQIKSWKKRAALEKLIKHL